MNEKKIIRKIGLLDIEVTDQYGDEAPMHIYKVEIVGDFGDKYEIKYLDQLAGNAGLSNKKYIYSKERIYGINNIEKEPTWLERKMDEWGIKFN
ncbi:unnamed protein product [marine sediment metagenome]|uniref:Uncharacterized protein n=1 Tax=marine sediment metagenome TaxID=412755 RepID=X0SW98_9ZZZZ